METFIGSRTSLPAGTCIASTGERDEVEILREAAEVFRRRDEIEAMLRAVDAQVRVLTQEYSRRTKVWGYTPLMLRKEARMRGLA